MRIGLAWRAPAGEPAATHAAQEEGRGEDTASPACRLYAAIGTFLHDHALSPDPVHYAFAHAALTDPAIATAVARLTEGGVRLNRQAIESLGGSVAPGSAPLGGRTTGKTVRLADRRAAELVAETRAQVDGFADLMQVVREETTGFGRDMAASAAALTRQADRAGLTELAALAQAMERRVEEAERRLASATAEADGLRAKLAVAQDEARRDPLTGLPNRLALEEAFARAQGSGAALCIAVADVDHFKQLNDRHGHGVGDRVLTAIGQGLAAACAGHLVARHGGEEFVVLFEATPLAGAAAVLDAARVALGTRRLRDRDTDAALGRLTFSAGAIALAPGEPLDAALARADRLLYAAKDAGRDRIHAE